MGASAVEFCDDSIFDLVFLSTYPFWSNNMEWVAIAGKAVDDAFWREIFQKIAGDRDILVEV